MSSRRIRYRTASYHEAGHAVVGWVLDQPPTYVSVLPENRICKFSLPEKVMNLEHELARLSGGVAANKRLSPKRGTADLLLSYGSKDLADMKRLIAECNCKSHEAWDLIDSAIERASKIVAANWDKVVALATVLQERKELDRDEINHVITYGKYS